MHVERGRLGQFIVLVGLILLGVFFATDQSQNPQYLYFCGGALAVLAGGFAWWRALAPPPAESARFRRVRKWQQAREEKKKNAKK